MTELEQKNELNLQPDLFLGYGGDVGKRSHIPIIVAGGALALLCVIFGFIVHLLFGKTLAIPPGTIMLTSVSSRVELPTDSPDVWKETRALSPHLPILVGYEKDSIGELQPFGIHAGLTRWKTYGYEYISDSKISPYRLWSRIGSFFSSAWLGIWPDTFLENTKDSNTFNINGRITNQTWRTNIPTPQIIDYPTIVIPTMNRISVRAVPNLWPKIRQQFESRGLSFGEETPVIVQWSQTNNTIDLLLEFDTSPSIKTRERIAAESGIVDIGSFQLPDGSIGRETRTPTIDEGDQSFELEDGRLLRFWDRFVYLGSPNPEFVAPQPAPCSDLPAFAVFDETTVKNLTDSFDLPHLLPQERISFTPNRDTLDICW